VRRKRLAFQLSRPKLCLEVHERTLHLDVDDLRRAGEDEIGGTGVARRDRQLEADLPARMRTLNDRLGNLHLSGVTEAERRHRIEAPSELVPACGSEAGTRVEGDVADATFGPADRRLAKGGKLSQASLAQPGDHPSQAEFSAEQQCKMPRSRRADVSGSTTKGTHGPEPGTRWLTSCPSVA
jgi:hypothetical protein